MKDKQSKLGAAGGLRFRTGLLLLASVLLVSFGALAQTTDPNVTAVDSAATTIQTTFGTIFAVGVAVVVALICRKYLRRAS